MNENDSSANGESSKKRKLDYMNASDRGGQNSASTSTYAGHSGHGGLSGHSGHFGQNAYTGYEGRSGHSGHGTYDGYNGHASEAPEMEIRRLEGALQKADESLRQTQAAREAIAARLSELGQVVVVKPWTQEHLRTVMEQHLDEFQSEYTLCDREQGLPEDAKEDAIRILKMRKAIFTGFESDGTGYRDADGSWVDFEPTEEDLRAFRWEDADSLW